MNSNRIYLVSYFVIGALILINISLVSTLFNKGFNLVSQWIIEAIVIGLFTLTGAGTGAFLAGQYTVKSVEKQIEHTEREVERIRRTNSDNALRIFDYLIEDIFSVYSYTISPFIAGRVHMETLERAVNEYKEPIKKLENVLHDTQLLSKISQEYITEIPSGIRRELSHLKNIIRAVNNHQSSYNEKEVLGIGEDINRVYCGLKKIQVEINIIVKKPNDTSANR
ncbi:hypothetical protein [Planococcus halocryophilus]|uniref:hypothetical protein n=1 Tax=Planococcus halocryophilus TaxID=1215089 RepID=UPI001F113C0F|nr:hypothetical protein [Planococcus halocryophilus]MCH4825778.1 hypothetical protein [Planococcus halocryophilus]